MLHAGGIYTIRLGGVLVLADMESHMLSMITLDISEVRWTSGRQPVQGHVMHMGKVLVRKT